MANEFEPATKKRKSDVAEQDSPLQAVKSQLWDQVVENDGAVELDDLCEDVERDQVTSAVNALIEEGRLMLSNGIVYQID